MAVSPSLIAEAVGWRREFHAAPELGYQEQETSRRVAELLASFGLQVHRGLAGTGVVATLENGPGPVIGLATRLPPRWRVRFSTCTIHSAAAARASLR